MRRPRLAAAAIFIALAAAAVFIHALWPAPATVWCDNGTDDDVLVARDGELVARVPRHELRALSIPSGAHRLEARTGARTVDEERLELHRGQRWVWNVAGVQRYAVYTMTYGQDRDVGGPREVEAGRRLFPLPADVSPEFMQPLPPTILAPHGSTTASARALYHFPLHAGRTCCHTR